MTTVGSTTSTTSTQASTAASSKVSLGSDFNTFLTMLTTQLKNQDPLSPMDSTQFTSQLVQYSSVEQQINANSNLEKLISLQQSASTAQGINYLGQTVEVSGTTLPLQDGSASYTYTLPKAAASTTIQIKDSDGKVVKTVTGDTTAGAHSMTWDGKDSDDTQLSDGKYSINVIATAADGSTLTTTTTTFGKVTKVVNDATNGTQLYMEAGDNKDMTVAMSSIVSVKDNSSTVSNAQMAAANAQYQAALAQLQALQSASSGSNTTTE